eukprot:3912755-Heterocapsa_arctica.AAC.1
MGHRLGPAFPPDEEEYLQSFASRPFPPDEELDNYGQEDAGPTNFVNFVNFVGMCDSTRGNPMPVLRGTSIATIPAAQGPPMELDRVEPIIMELA